jgi:preprotein translocase subunit SecG
MVCLEIQNCAGWIVTFLQEKRGAGASAGYISSAFFGGKGILTKQISWLLIQYIL